MALILSQFLQYTRQDLFSILGEKTWIDVAENGTGSSVGGTLPLKLVLKQSTSMLLGTGDIKWWSGY